MQKNRPFPSSPGALHENEVKCSAFHMEMIFHSHANKTHFTQERLCTWPHFESEGFWNSEVAYFVRFYFDHVCSASPKEILILNLCVKPPLFNIFNGFKYHQR